MHSQFGEEEETSQGSPTQTDFEVNPLVNPQLLTIHIEFKVDVQKLLKDFKSKENKSKRHEHKNDHTKKQMAKIVKSWRNFMNDICTEIKFFDYLEKYYKKVNTVTKT